MWKKCFYRRAPQEVCKFCFLEPSEKLESPRSIAVENEEDKSGEPVECLKAFILLIFSFFTKENQINIKMTKLKQSLEILIGIILPESLFSEFFPRGLSNGVKVLICCSISANSFLWVLAEAVGFKAFIRRPYLQRDCNLINYI